VDGNATAVNPVLEYRSRDYGPAAFDRTHVFTLDYAYNLPRVSKVWDNAFTRIGLDGWELSGVTNFQTGQPQGLPYALTYTADLTGTTNTLASNSTITTTGSNPGSNPVIGYDSRVVLVAWTQWAVVQRECSGSSRSGAVSQRNRECL
jgi:hypothetical protein